MQYVDLVSSARLGNDKDFGRLVGLFTPRLLAWVGRRIANTDDAEEIVQDSLILAWHHLGSLRTPEAFPSWLFAVARRQLDNRYRSNGRERARKDHRDPESLAATSGDDQTDPWARDQRWQALMAVLSESQRMAVELRYVAGFSLAEIAAVTGVSENRTKSRLHEARQRLRADLGRIPRQSRYQQHLAEQRSGELRGAVMSKIDALRLGAYMVERLSLHDQLVLVKTIQAGQALPESLLRAMGQIDRGAEFLKLYGSTLTAGEFFSIMMSVDRFTENRMVDTLESQDAELAEWIKKQTFVFEDFIICEAPVLKLLMQKVDRRVLELALLATSADIRQSFLAAMTVAEAEGLKAGMATVDADSMRIRLAQEELIRTLRDLDMRGQIRFEQPDAEGKGTFRFYLVA